MPRSFAVSAISGGISSFSGSQLRTFLRARPRLRLCEAALRFRGFGAGLPRKPSNSWPECKARRFEARPKMKRAMCPKRRTHASTRARMQHFPQSSICAPRLWASAPSAAASHGKATQTQLQERMMRQAEAMRAAGIVHGTVCSAGARLRIIAVSGPGPPVLLLVRLALALLLLLVCGQSSSGKENAHSHKRTDTRAKHRCNGNLHSCSSRSRRPFL